MGEIQSLQRDSHAALSMAASFKRGIGRKIWLSGGADRDRTDDLPECHSDTLPTELRPRQIADADVSAKQLN